MYMNGRVGRKLNTRIILQCQVTVLKRLIYYLPLQTIHVWCLKIVSLLIGEKLPCHKYLESNSQMASKSRLEMTFAVTSSGWRFSHDFIPPNPLNCVRPFPKNEKSSPPGRAVCHGLETSTWLCIYTTHFVHLTPTSMYDDIMTWKWFPHH